MQKLELDQESTTRDIKIFSKKNTEATLIITNKDV